QGASERTLNSEPQEPRTRYRSEPEPNLQLRVAQRLGASRRAEPRVLRLETSRIQRAVRQVLRVDDGLVGRAAIDHVGVAVVVDHRVEHVEDVPAKLQGLVAANLD